MKQHNVISNDILPANVAVVILRRGALINKKNLSPCMQLIHILENCESTQINSPFSLTQRIIQAQKATAFITRRAFGIQVSPFCINNQTQKQLAQKLIQILKAILFLNIDHYQFLYHLASFFCIKFDVSHIRDKKVEKSSPLVSFILHCYPNPMIKQFSNNKLKIKQIILHIRNESAITTNYIILRLLAIVISRLIKIQPVSNQQYTLPLKYQYVDLVLTQYYRMGIYYQYLQTGVFQTLYSTLSLSKLQDKVTHNIQLIIGKQIKTGITNFKVHKNQISDESTHDSFCEIW
ncbi:unnamed protein product (macronuclear) [Paramecium tetraurelia]|uniref:Uncharacterized protein n=1 Tax=Paramecium tetraurelia TaxID=5888 RepID=A0CAY9_PARTE|nr:uncharacterized protein GSPATT00036739001 [Paramecium tetraurelia]CAK67956.1 unnamed protein product [Paramecium tetraurelia]|eukprot:XP_001435353.1 hypothetical protein (macronuclear) [Paramecium tetraurelia strain d4-2]